MLAAISHWSDSMAGEKDSFYAADAAMLSGNIDQGLITRGEYSLRNWGIAPPVTAPPATRHFPEG